MMRLTAARDQVQRASGLAALLDAACDVFEHILTAIGEHEDARGMTIPFLLAATQAANGRDAVLFAPSLPSRRLHEPPAPAAVQLSASSEAITTALGELSGLLAIRLACAARQLHASGDRSACQDAARCARQIRDLLAREPQ